MFRCAPFLHIRYTSFKSLFYGKMGVSSLHHLSPTERSYKTESEKQLLEDSEKETVGGSLRKKPSTIKPKVHLSAFPLLVPSRLVSAQPGSRYHADSPPEKALQF